MSDQAQQEKPPTGKRPIGGIGQYATIGGGAKRSEVETATSPDFQTSRLPERQTVSSPEGKRSKHPEWKQQTLYLPPDLIKRLKREAFEADREISEIAADLLDAGLHLIGR